MDFLVSNVSILSFAHGKIADANFPPVVSPADLKCKFTSYNKNTPNISPQKSPVKNISPGAYFRNFTASNSNIQKGCPKARKPGNPIVKALTSHDILLNLVYSSSKWSIRSTKYLPPRAMRTPNCLHSGVVTIEASVDLACESIRFFRAN